MLMDGSLLFERSSAGRSRNQVLGPTQKQHPALLLATCWRQAGAWGEGALPGGAWQGGGTAPCGCSLERRQRAGQSHMSAGGSAIARFSPFQGEPFSIPNRLVLGEADITSKVFPGSSCQMLILIITTIIIKRLGSEPSHL